jgi:methyl-accepting chemotaxis protein
MSSSESSAFEYRRRLPEVPRTVRFSGDVLNRIDDVADKIESVGSRMRQVENIISDNRILAPQKDQKTELIRLREDVNRTLASIDPVAQNASPYASDGTDEIRSNLQRINAKIFEVSSEKERQSQEIEELRRKLSESQVINQLQSGELIHLEFRSKRKSRRKKSAIQSKRS